jgi:hypothetical protein
MWPHRAHARVRGRVRNAIGVAMATIGMGTRRTGCTVVARVAADQPQRVSAIVLLAASLEPVRVVLLEGRNHFLPWNSEADVRDAIRGASGPSR